MALLIVTALTPSVDTVYPPVLLKVNVGLVKSTTISLSITPELELSDKTEDPAAALPVVTLLVVCVKVSESPAEVAEVVALETVTAPVLGIYPVTTELEKSATFA